MRQYKLVVIDVDNTLKPEDGSIPYENVSAIREASDQRGVRIAIASGRPPESIRASLARSCFDEDLLEQIHVIGFNGAETTQGGESIHSVLLPEDAVERVIRFCRAAGGTNAAVFAGGQFSMLRGRVLASLLRSQAGLPRCRSVGREPPGSRVHKVVVMSEAGYPAQREKVDRLLADLEGVIWWRATTQWSDREAPAEWAEVMAAGVDKGAATRCLAEGLDIDLSLVVCIGDGINDREMLEIPEVWSVVMRNTVYDEELLRMPKLHVVAPDAGADPPGVAQAFRWLGIDSDLDDGE